MIAFLFLENVKEDFWALSLHFYQIFSIII